MKLKQILFERKIKQNKMAEDLGINKTTLNNYVNGNTEPDIHTLIKIANYLDVSLDFLFDRQYNNQIGYIPDERRETVKKLASLNDIQFEKVSSYIDAIIDMN